MIITLILAAIGITSVLFGQRMENEREEWDKKNSILQDIQDLSSGIYEDYQLILWYNVIFDVSDAQREEIKSQRESTYTENTALLSSIKGNLIEDMRFNSALTKIDLFLYEMNEMFEVIANNHNETIRSSKLVRLENLIFDIMESDGPDDDEGLDYISLTLKADVDEANEKAKYAQTRMNYFTVGGLSAAIFLSVVLGIFITIIITKPIKDLTKMANRLSRGETDVDADTIKTSVQELAVLRDSFGRMANSYLVSMEMIQQMSSSEEEE